MSETLGEVLKGVILPGVGSVLLVGLFSLARALAGQLKSERQQEALLALVKAAEQLYGEGKGEAKRRFVRERMKQQGLKELGREQIEAAVFEIKQGEQMVKTVTAAK